jgi:hypothetical protein
MVNLTSRPRRRKADGTFFEEEEKNKYKIFDSDDDDDDDDNNDNDEKTTQPDAQMQDFGIDAWGESDRAAFDSRVRLIVPTSHPVQPAQPRQSILTITPVAAAATKAPVSTAPRVKQKYSQIWPSHRATDHDLYSSLQNIFISTEFFEVMKSPVVIHKPFHNVFLSYFIATCKRLGYDYYSDPGEHQTACVLLVDHKDPNPTWRKCVLQHITHQNPATLHTRKLWMNRDDLEKVILTLLFVVKIHTRENPKVAAPSGLPVTVCRAMWTFNTRSVAIPWRNPSFESMFVRSAWLFGLGCVTHGIVSNFNLRDTMVEWHKHVDDAPGTLSVAVNTHNFAALIVLVANYIYWAHNASSVLFESIVVNLCSGVVDELKQSTLCSLTGVRLQHLRFAGAGMEADHKQFIGNLLAKYINPLAALWRDGISVFMALREQWTNAHKIVFHLWPFVMYMHRMVNERIRDRFASDVFPTVQWRKIREMSGVDAEHVLVHHNKGWVLKAAYGVHDVVEAGLANRPAQVDPLVHWYELDVSPFDMQQTLQMANVNLGAMYRCPTPEVAWVNSGEWRADVHRSLFFVPLQSDGDVQFSMAMRMAMDWKPNLRLPANCSLLPCGVELARRMVMSPSDMVSQWWLLLLWWVSGCTIWEQQSVSWSIFLGKLLSTRDSTQRQVDVGGYWWLCYVRSFSSYIKQFCPAVVYHATCTHLSTCCARTAELVKSLDPDIATMSVYDQLHVELKAESIGVLLECLEHCTHDKNRSSFLSRVLAFYPDKDKDNKLQKITPRVDVPFPGYTKTPALWQSIGRKREVRMPVNTRHKPQPHTSSPSTVALFRRVCAIFLSIEHAVRDLDIHMDVNSLDYEKEYPIACTNGSFEYVGDVVPVCVSDHSNIIFSDEFMYMFDKCKRIVASL